MNSKLNVKVMVEVALVTALLCILCPWQIPLGFSPVPISLAVFAVMIGVYAIGWKLGTLACLLYILLGLVGVPVFAGFSAGLPKLAGPTGGYILGYLLVAIVTGLAVEKFEEKIWVHIIGMVLGVALCYILGTIWFLQVMEEQTLASALSMCVIPFIPADAVKIVVAAIVGPIIRRQLKRIQ